MSETCRGHLWEKIIVKLFASSWYIFLTYIYDARSHLHQNSNCYVENRTPPDIVTMICSKPVRTGFWARSQNCEKWLSVSSCLSYRQHGTTRLLQVGFSWNLIFENFSKIWWEVKRKSDKNNGYFTWRRLYVDLWKYLPEFFLERQMFQTKVLQKIKTHITCSVHSSWKSCRLWDNLEKYCRTGQATDDNITRLMHFGCFVTKATDAHSEYVIRISFSRPQWLRERAWMLLYKYVACQFVLRCHILSNFMFEWPCIFDK